MIILEIFLILLLSLTMPIKKKTTSLDKENVKICPYCANEISVRAKKCKYCGEFLTKDMKKEMTMSKSVGVINEGLISKSKKSAITSGKVLYGRYIRMFIWVGIGFLGGLFDWGLTENSTYLLLDVIISFIPVILLMIRSNKSYKYLLNKNTENLRFSSTGWPTRGWICPVACLFIPYQTVKDIYKTFNVKSGIVGWWWACYLASAFLIRMVNYSVDDRAGYVALVGICFLIAEYVLMINIIQDVNSALENDG